MQCMKPSCEDTASVQLGWVAYSHGLDPNKKMRISGYLAVGVCEACAEKATAADVMNDESLVFVNTRLVLTGKVPVKLADVQVAYMEITGDKFYLPSAGNVRQ